MAIINRLKERSKGFSEVENNLKALSIMNLWLKTALPMLQTSRYMRLINASIVFPALRRARRGMAQQDSEG